MSKTSIHAKNKAMKEWLEAYPLKPKKAKPREAYNKNVKKYEK